MCNEWDGGCRGNCNWTRGDKCGDVEIEAARGSNYGVGRRDHLQTLAAAQGYDIAAVSETLIYDVLYYLWSNEWSNWNA